MATCNRKGFTQSIPSEMARIMNGRKNLRVYQFEVLPSPLILQEGNLL